MKRLPDASTATARRTIQFGIGRRAPVAIITCDPVARHRCDNPVGAHLADALIAHIRNEQVAGGIHRHAQIIISGCIQFSIGCRAPVTRVTVCPIARHGGDNPIGAYFADADVTIICNK